MSFPDKNKGDKLAAAHVNAINRECRKIAARSVPWNQDLEPWVQTIVEVTGIVNVTRGWYQVRPRHFSYLESDVPWRTESSTEHQGWNLDISGLYKSNVTPPALRIGAIGVAYWDAQRSTFIPVFIDTETIILFELAEDRAYDDDESDVQLVRWNGSAYAKVTPLTDFDMIAVAPAGKWVGKVGYRGWARMAEHRLSQPDSGSQNYPITSQAGKPIIEIIYLEAPARWWRFSLAADPEAGPDPALFHAVTNGGNESSFWGGAPNHKVPQPGQGTGELLKVYDYDGFLKRAKKGAYGWAVYFEGDDKWIVQACDQKASFVRFTLTQALSGGSSSGSESTAGNATVTDYWGEEIWDRMDPGAKVTVFDIMGAFTDAPVGARGLAVYDWDADKYNIILCEGYASHIGFTLTENFINEHSTTSSTYYEARASVDMAIGTNGWELISPTATPSVSIRVYDYQRLYKYGLKGAKGIAVLDWNVNKFVVIACQQRTMTLSGQLGMAMTTAAGPWLVNIGSILDHTPFNQAPARDDGTPEAGIYAFNVFGFEADANALCYCKWNETANRWEIFQVMCPA